MRRMGLLIAAGAILLATPVFAIGPYVGLYGGVYDADYVEGPGGYDHSANSVFTSQPYSDIEMWIWWKPDPAKGLAAVEFKIVYPSGTYIIQGSVTKNPLIVVELGTLSVGITSAINLPDCQYDWWWSHHQTITVKNTTWSGYIQIVADPMLAVPPFTVLVSDCSYYNWATNVISELMLNYSNPVEDKTWGSIKSLYNE